MKDPLERKSLPVRLADEIEQSIQKSDWGEYFPGHRVLMKNYSVSAKTCLAAISQLEARGVISSGEQGKKRRILVKSKSTLKSMSNLLVIEGCGPLSGEDIQQLHTYQTIWEEAGGSVQQVRFDLPRYRRPASLIHDAVQRYRADAILLHVPPAAWVRAAMAERPVFLAGGEFIRADITGVGYNIQAELPRLVARLKAMGHERIAVPFYPVGPRMEEAIQQGVAQGLGLKADSKMVRDCCPIFPERVAAAWQEYWKKLFSSLKPTAVILNQDIHVQSLYGFCFRNGIKIPRDISVICMESTEHVEWCEPLPTRMRFPIEVAGAYFKKWVRGGCVALGVKYLDLEWIEGESVGKNRS